MAKKKENEQEGVWRTIGGRRVFIKKGQSLSDAMKESGKFKKTSDVKRGTYQRENAYVEYENHHRKLQDVGSKINKLEEEFRNTRYAPEVDEKYYSSQDYKNKVKEKLKLENQYQELSAKENSELEEYGMRNYYHPKQYKGKISELEGKHINSEKYKKASSDIKNANDKELRDMSKGWATLSGTDIDNKNEQAEIKRLAKQELANRKDINEQEFHYAGEELYSDDPNRFGDKMRKYNDKMNPTKNNTFQDMIREGKMNKEEAYVNDLEIYSLGEYGKGTYIQFQDIKKNKYDDIMKYPNASPREESNTWARVWEDGKNTLNIEDSKYGARKQVIDYLDKKDNKAVKELDKKTSNEIENSIKSLYIYQDEKNMGSMSSEPLKEYYNKYGKENVDKVWKDMDKKYVVAKGTNVDYEGVHYNNLLNRDDYSKEALDKYISGLNSLRESGLGYSQPKEYNEKSRNLMSELERSKISRQDISPMSEWSDTTGTGFSDLQSTTLKNRYKGTYEYLKNTKNMSGTDILELLKKIDEDKK